MVDALRAVVLPQVGMGVEVDQAQRPAAADRLNLNQSVSQFDTLVQRFHQHVLQQRPTPEKQRQIMATLFGSIGLPVPADAHFPETLTDTFRLSSNHAEAFPPSRVLKSYITASIQGVEETRTLLHNVLCDVQLNP